ncbi:MAG: hypothetical protein AAGF92_08825 [Myxococcota bacterium]
MKRVIPMALIALLSACGDEGVESLDTSESVVSVESFCIDFCGEGTACIQSCVDTCIERLWQTDLPDCTQVPPRL